MKFKDILLASCLSALLYSIINDAITGSSLDILVPMLSFLIPGEIDEPLHIGRTKLYIHRWMVRMCNLMIGITIAYFLHKNVHINNKAPKINQIVNSNPKN